MGGSLLDYTPFAGGKRLGNMTGVEIEMLGKHLEYVARIKRAEEAGEDISDDLFKEAVRRLQLQKLIGSQEANRRLQLQEYRPIGPAIASEVE